MILKNGKRIDGSSLTSIAVVDDLLGGVGTTEALSANQGRILNEKIEAINSFDVIRLDENSPAYVENAPNGALGINLWQLETGIYTFPDNTDFYYGTTDQITLEPTEGGLYYNAEPPLIGELRVYKEDSFVWAICECGSVKYTTISIILEEAIIGTLYEDNINSYQKKLVSGENIKTIDGESILDSGDIALAEVAKTGNYNDLSNKPTIPTVPTNISAFTNDRGYITGYTETDPTVPSHVKAITTANIEDWNNKSEFSGSYDDLTNKPTIPSKTSELTNDSGFLTGVPDNYVTETDLAEVAKSNDYNDLDNTPQQLSDFVDDIGLVTASDLAKVATTGSYNDLLNLPDLSGLSGSIQAKQLYNDTDNPAYVEPVEETGEFQGYNVYQLETGMYIIPDNTMLYYGTSAKGSGEYKQLYEGLAEGLLIVANDPDGANCQIVSSALIDVAGITYNYSFYDTEDSIFALMAPLQWVDLVAKTELGDLEATATTTITPESHPFTITEGSTPIPQTSNTTNLEFGIYGATTDYSSIHGVTLTANQDLKNLTLKFKLDLTPNSSLDWWGSCKLWIESQSDNPLVNINARDYGIKEEEFTIDLASGDSITLQYLLDESMFDDETGVTLTLLSYDAVIEEPTVADAINEVDKKIQTIPQCPVFAGAVFVERGSGNALACLFLNDSSKVHTYKWELYYTTASTAIPSILYSSGSMSKSDVESQNNYIGGITYPSGAYYRTVKIQALDFDGNVIGGTVCQSTEMQGPTF